MNIINIDTFRRRLDRIEQHVRNMRQDLDTEEAQLKKAAKAEHITCDYEYEHDNTAPCPRTAIYDVSRPGYSSYSCRLHLSGLVRKHVEANDINDTVSVTKVEL